MAYGDFIDLTRRTDFDKALRNKAFNIDKNPKYDEYQWGLASMVYQFFDKITSGTSFKNENIYDKQLAEELHKAIIRKLEKRKVHSPFIDNISGTDLADVQLISKFHQGIRFWLCIIDFCSRYAWILPLEDKKGTIITNAFQNISNYRWIKAANFIIDQFNHG